jgi:hypothetical protein
VRYRLSLRYRRLSSSYKKATGDWWLAGGISAANCIAAYQPKGAASYAASLSNLANPGTYDATEGTAPDWASGTGWTFDNANSEYLKTGVSNAMDRTYSMIVRFDNASAGVYTMCGNYADGASANAFLIAPNRSSEVYYFSGSRQEYTTSPNLSAGILALAGTAGYRNGELDAAFTEDGTGTVGEIYIGALNYNSGTPLQEWSGNIYAIAIYSVGITADQVSALTTAMNAL